MELQITARNTMNKISKVESADGRFQWHEINPDDLIDRKANKSIYRMAYSRTDCFGADEITDESTIILVKDFWQSLSTLQDKTAAELEQQELVNIEPAPSPRRNYPICPKCGTVCYGDCQD